MLYKKKKKTYVCIAGSLTSKPADCCLSGLTNGSLGSPALRHLPTLWSSPCCTCRVCCSCCPWGRGWPWGSCCWRGCTTGDDAMRRTQRIFTSKSDWNFNRTFNNDGGDDDDPGGGGDDGLRHNPDQDSDSCSNSDDRLGQ